MVISRSPAQYHHRLLTGSQTFTRQVPRQFQPHNALQVFEVEQFIGHFRHTEIQAWAVGTWSETASR